MNKHLMALAVAGVFAAAHAQDDTSDKIEKVEVTATRTGAVDVQQVPAAITVIKPDSLTKYGQGTLSDIAKLVPAISLQEQGEGANNITIPAWWCAVSFRLKCRMRRWWRSTSMNCR
jgi:outer membrane receptor for ferrienterochelin and colicin